MTAEIGRYISPDEWGYLEGVVDQLLVFGIWPNNKRGGFVHRINAFSTSKTVIDYLHDQFGGKTGERNKQNSDPPGNKLHYEWRLANAEAGLDFLELSLDHLHFKRPLAEKYAAFLKSKLDGSGDTDEKLTEFRRVKLASPSDSQPNIELYLPTIRNLAGRLDADGFIGIQTETKSRSSRPYAFIMLQTEFPELGLGLKQKHKGDYSIHRVSKVWTATNVQAVNVLKEVLPHLRNTRENAKLVLDFHDINNLLSRKRRNSRQRELLLGVLQLVSPGMGRDQLRELYIEKFRQMNAHPI